MDSFAVKLHQQLSYDKYNTVIKYIVRFEFRCTVTIFLIIYTNSYNDIVMLQEN